MSWLKNYLELSESYELYIFGIKIQ